LENPRRIVIKTWKKTGSIRGENNLGGGGYEKRGRSMGKGPKRTTSSTSKFHKRGLTIEGRVIV